MSDLSETAEQVRQLESLRLTVRLLARGLRFTEKQVRRLSRKLQRAEQKALGGEMPRRSKSRRGFSEEVEAALKQVAHPVESVFIRILPDGSGEAAIDGGRPLHLTEKLTALLCLALGGERDGHGVAGFLPLPRVAKLMGAKRHTVTNLVYRLRQQLYEHGHNPFLLETRTPNHAPSEIRFRARNVLVTKREGDVDFPDPSCDV